MRGAFRPVLVGALFLLAAAGARADQSALQATTQSNDPVLKFDWPAIEVGIGSYEDGPTGLTVIRFKNRATVTVDSRGGAPGTVNTDALRLGYGRANTDAVVFSGGSAYGEEAITAVASGLKDQGVRSGDWTNIAFVPGAVIYDLGPRRLNEIYPDKRLAQAALAAAQPGVFPLGAQGAGRMAMQGGFFRCNAHSGQGGAFRQVGDIKIAAFVVVNASGSITDRDGRLVRCGRPVATTAELLRDLPASHRPDRRPAAPSEPEAPATSNTTISLVVTNQKLGFAALQRVAVQVHMSMGRAIQPFSTMDDGDTLFAASTQEVDGKDLDAETLSTLAGEVMWDAVLASVPEHAVAAAPEVGHPAPSASALASYAGTYDFTGPAPTPGSYGGLGLRFTLVPGGARLTPVADEPAARAGLRDGDLLLAVDGAPVVGLSVSELTAKLRGPAGTAATLVWTRPDHDGPVNATVTRETIHRRPLLRVEAKNDELWAEAVGGRPLFGLAAGKPTRLMPISDTEFVISNRPGTSIAFTRDGAGAVTGAVLNPGHWQQEGRKVE